MPGCQNGSVLPRMTLRRTDIANSAVPMVMIVPMREVCRPVPGLIQADKALGRELGAVLGGAKQGHRRCRLSPEGVNKTA